MANTIVPPLDLFRMRTASFSPRRFWSLSTWARVAYQKPLPRGEPFSTLSSPIEPTPLLLPMAMDPMAALSVAAAVLQFGEAVAKIAVRLATFAEKRVKVPEEVALVGVRLQALNGCLADMDTEGRADLHGLVKSLTARCARLAFLLDRWRPAEDTTRVRRLLSGFNSLVEDGEMNSLSRDMFKDIQLLTLRAVTPAKQHGVASNGQPASGRVVSMLPEERRVRNLVPRDDVVGDIRAAFSASGGEEPHVVILQGMGGQGKTQLALEYCRQGRRNHWYAGIFWVDSSDALSAAKAVGAISRKLHPGQAASDDDTQVGNTKDTLESWTAPWLIVFDNYDDPRRFPVKKFYPASALGHVLITSRSPALSAEGRLIRVPDMSESEGVDLLFSRGGLSRDSDSEGCAKQIVKRLGYLPLAIAQAGAYLGRRRHTMAVGDFLAYYERRTASVLSYTPDVWEYLGHTAASATHEENIKSVFTTWNFSLELLGETADADHKMLILFLLAFFSISDISESLFVSYYDSFDAARGDRPVWLEYLGEGNAWSRDRFRDVVNEFSDYSLISTAQERDDESGPRSIHVSLHPLVRDWIVLRLDDATRKSCYETASHMLAHDVLRFRWTLPYHWGFRLDSTQRNTYLSHINVWEANHANMRSDELPMIVSLPPGHRRMAVEGIVAEFYEDSVLHSQGLRWSQWLWESCDRESAPWPTIRFWAGWTRSWALVNQETEASILAAIASAREIVEHGRRDPDFAADGQYHLAWTLLSAGTSDRNQDPEARLLLESFLRRTDLPTRQQHAGMALLIQSLLEWPESREDEVRARSTLNRLLEETEEKGGKEFRRANWNMATWYMAANYLLLENQAAGHSLAQECEAAMDGLVSRDHHYYLMARNTMGRSYLIRHEYANALQVLSSCVPATQLARSRKDAVRLARESLAECYICLKRYDEARVLLAEAITSRLEELNVLWLTVDKLARLLAQAFIEEKNQKAAILACHFRIGLQSRAITEGSSMIIAYAQQIQAQVQMFGAKQLPCSCHRGLDHFNIADVVGHLDAAISIFPAAGTGPAERRKSDSSQHEAALGYSTVGIRHWYVCNLLLPKAIYLARRGDYEHAIPAFADSKASFEAIKGIDERVAWLYLETVWLFLAWTIPGLPLADRDFAGIPATISWACAQARGRFGGDGTRKRVRQGILKYRNLLQHLPEDEPYTEGLGGVDEAPPSATGPPQDPSDQEADGEAGPGPRLPRREEEDGQIDGPPEAQEPEDAREGSYRAPTLEGWLPKRRGGRSDVHSEGSAFPERFPFRRKHQRQFSTEKAILPASALSVAVALAMTSPLPEEPQ